MYPYLGPYLSTSCWCVEPLPASGPHLLRLSFPVTTACFCLSLVHHHCLLLPLPPPRSQYLHRTRSLSLSLFVPPTPLTHIPPPTPPTPSRPHTNHTHSNTEHGFTLCPHSAIGVHAALTTFRALLPRPPARDGDESSSGSSGGSGVKAHPPPPLPAASDSSSGTSIPAPAPVSPGADFDFDADAGSVPSPAPLAMVCVLTAHPAKFEEAVRQATGAPSLPLSPAAPRHTMPLSVVHHTPPTHSLPFCRGLSPHAPPRPSLPTAHL